MIDFSKFPPLESATEDGLLTMGGDLSVDTLVSAYAQGIFPWFSEGQPILWWSPDPRLVLFPREIKISRSLAKTIKRGDFEIRCNSAFPRVLECCALRGNTKPFSHQASTWITQDMATAYNDLFDEGYAHSVEVWRENKLVGGLYGLILGSVFFGESMFSDARDASKIALVALCKSLKKLDFQVIDCQITSDHLLSLGATEIPRSQFAGYLQDIDLDKPNTDFAKYFITTDLINS